MNFFCSCKEQLQKRKEGLSEAFNKANNKDIQLTEAMTQLNNTRKKNKVLILEEKKKLDKLKQVPTESQKVNVICAKLYCTNLNLVLGY